MRQVFEALRLAYDQRLSQREIGRALGLSQSWYAKRPRGMRGKADPAAADGRPAIVFAPRLSPTEATRREAALLQQIFEVDPLPCTTSRGPMRIIACITQASVIDQILAHLRIRAARESHARPGAPHRHGILS